MPATLTPLRYPGGKTKYTKLFLDIISMNSLENCTFVEVFAGGAGAAIKLLLGGHVKAVFLNDLDVSIYSFWKAIKECPDDLMRLIHDTPVSMKEWKRQREIYAKKDIADLLSLAFSTFYLNRCNHAGILEARPIGGMKQEGTYRIDSRFNKATSISKIGAIAEHADSIEVFNLNWKDYLRLLKRKHRNRKLLIYFDPPYHQKGPALYMNHFEYADHKELRDSIFDCPFSWILSYDSHEDIIGLYRSRNCKVYQNTIRHTIAGNASAKELIIGKMELPDYLEPLCCHA